MAEAYSEFFGPVHSALPVCIYLQIVDCPLFCHSQFSRKISAGNTLFLPIVWLSRSQRAIYGLLLNRTKRLCMKASGCTAGVIVNTKQLMVEQRDGFMAFFRFTSRTRF